MNNYITILSFAFLTTTISYPMEKVDNTVIPNSSYMIYEGQYGIISGVPNTSRNVTFYTCNGDPIATEEHYFRFRLMSRKLDPAAPKPQPIKYEIKYWPAVSCPDGMKKGVPGDFILFYDKNGNQIKSYRYDKTQNQITVFTETGSNVYQFNSSEDPKALTNFPLDLSVVSEAK